MRTKLAIAVLMAAVLTACSTAPQDAEPSGVVVGNAFVRATDQGSSAPYMTAAFMTITNNTDADVILSGGSASWAGMVQVHEVVDGVMRQKDGGLPIPAAGTVTLEMGGNHLMFMGMTMPLEAGEEVTFTLSFDDGSSIEVTAPVKSANAGSETYTAGMGAMASGMPESSTGSSM
jgi:hypothetical protein